MQTPRPSSKHGQECKLRAGVAECHTNYFPSVTSIGGKTDNVIESK